MELKNLNTAKQIETHKANFLCGINLLREILETQDIKHVWEVYEKGSNYFTQKAIDEVKPYLKGVPEFKRESLIQEAKERLDTFLLKRVDRIKNDFPNYLGVTKENLEFRNGDYLFTFAYEEELEKRSYFEPNKEELELLNKVKEYLRYKKELDPKLLSCLNFDMSDNEIITLIKK